jgi:alkylated DNA repair dioxygenase AlkB
MKFYFPNYSENLLPYDGTLLYFSELFSKEESSQYLTDLLNTTEWKQDELIMFGKKMITTRKVAWYGDREFSYIYSHKEKKALPWTDTILEIKNRVESFSSETFNSCLLNLYHSGKEGMAYHSDNESSILKNSCIASVSLGAERNFIFKHKLTQEKISLFLENGSILLMKDEIQSNWKHSLPKTSKVNTPRVNLTFRKMI